MMAITLWTLLLSAAPAAATPFDEGLRLMTAKHYPEAVTQLELAARAEPGSPDVLLNLGWAYWHDRRVDDARRVGTTLTRLDPFNKVFLVFLANVQIEKKDYRAARALSERALALAPGDRDASLALARALFLSGRRQEGVIVLDRLLERSPGEPAAVLRRALFLSELGRKREALDALDRLIAAEPANADARRGRARVLSELGRREEAATEWRFLTRRGTDPQALMNLGWAHWREKNHAAAWEIAATLLKLDDADPAFLRFAANLEIERGDYSEALRLARRAARLAPGDREVALLLSKALFRAHRVSEAQDALRALARTLPDDVLVKQRLAEMMVWTGRYDEALPQLDRLIKSDPDNDAYRLSRAAAWYEKGAFDAALAEWKALALRPQPNPEAQRRLRDDAFDRRDWSAAAEWQQKLLAGEPGDHAGWEKLAKILSAMGRPAEALAAVERARQADPVPLNSYYMRSELLAEMRDWAGAVESYEDVLRRNPGSVRAYEGLAFAQEGRGDYAAALGSLKRIATITSPGVSPYLALHEARLNADAGRPGRARALLAPLRADTRTRIPILLYHGIARHDRGESIPQEEFHRQMRALKDKGYSTLTASQLDRALRGEEELPEMPILITFDDGRTDSFVNADPVLAELGLRATMFVHTTKLRKPHFHASPEDIARWRATGRWEIQSHGFQAHDPLPLDADGRTGHFLPNRKWLAASGRLEDLQEYRARVEEDYRKAKQEVEAMLPGGEVVAFAYPYGDYGQTDESNTPESAAINQELVRKSFRLAFVQEQHGLNTLSSNPTDLRRFAVPRYMTAEQLMAHLALGDPRVQAELLEAQLWIRSDQPARALAAYEGLRARGVDEPRVWADEGVAYQKSGDLPRARDLYARAVEGASLDNEEGVLPRRLLAQSAYAAAPTASAEAEIFTDSDTNDIRKTRARGTTWLGPVRLEIWGGVGQYRDRRDPPLDLPVIRSREGGIGVWWSAGPRTTLEGSYARRAYEGGATGSSDEYAAAASRQVLIPLRLTVRAAGGPVETSAAVRAGRTSRGYGAGAAWDPAPDWRLSGDYDESRFNDDNRSRALNLRATRRLPLGASAGAGYLRADSSSSRPEYYTPRALQQYTGTFAVNRLLGAPRASTGLTPAELLLRYEGGYGYQASGGRVVHSARAVVTVRPHDRVTLSLDGRYAQSPTYISRRLQGAVAVGF